MWAWVHAALGVGLTAAVVSAPAVSSAGCIWGDCENGRGAYVYSNDSMYVGEFREGQLHGRGSLTADDGSVRVGTWERGRRISRELSMPAGQEPGGVAAGCTVGDCREGQGAYRWSNGSSYTGGFRDFKQDGRGILVYNNGASYAGEWRNGRRHGYGSFTEASGREYIGIWVNNRYLGPAVGGDPSTAADAEQSGWPDLSHSAPLIGGGERDAAVVIGLQDYSRMADIEGAGDNAASWVEYLVETRGIPPGRVWLLMNEDAELEGLRWAIETSARRVRKGGTLWFVFIGHGAPSKDGRDGLLVGFDAQREARSIELRSLRREELLAQLEASPAGFIQVYLDASFSGRSGDGRELAEDLRPLAATELGGTGDLRTTLLTAAQNHEYAGPLPGERRPAFSYLALGGLRGWADEDGDGKVTALELQGYVGRAMRTLVRDHEQRPTLIGSPSAELAPSPREMGPDLSKLALELSRGRH